MDFIIGGLRLWQLLKIQISYGEVYSDYKVKKKVLKHSWKPFFVA